MKKLFLIILILPMTFACEKKSKCYDASLVHNNPCTADCGGFLGCDGNTYCNQCEAARVGIGPM